VDKWRGSPPLYHVDGLKRLEKKRQTQNKTIHPADEVEVKTGGSDGVEAGTGPWSEGRQVIICRMHVCDECNG